VGRDSSVGIATRYGLDGPGIESRWGRGFTHLSRPALRAPSLLYNGYRVFSGGKATGAWRCPPTSISRRGQRKNGAIPLLHLWTFVDCSRMNFTLPLLLHSSLGGTSQRTLHLNLTHLIHLKMFRKVTVWKKSNVVSCNEF
jgi:hypothetical protein